jgi:hypothetical protein
MKKASVRDWYGEVVGRKPLVRTPARLPVTSLILMILMILMILTILTILMILQTDHDLKVRPTEKMNDKDARGLLKTA